jgi:hypothetical protein
MRLSTRKNYHSTPCTARSRAGQKSLINKQTLIR